MRVAVVCMIRSAERYFSSFRLRCDELNGLLAKQGHSMRVIVGENDSVDHTPELLKEWAETAPYEVLTIDRSEGGPHYPSIDHPDRWHHISHVMNGVLDQLDDEDDWAFYIDPDLLWNPVTAVGLLMSATFHHFDAVGPMSFHSTGRFFDIWGTRKNGMRFVAHPPYHPELPEGQRFVQADAIACCLLVRGDVARKTRFGEWDANVGWCEDIRKQGYVIWLDLQERVTHP